MLDRIINTQRLSIIPLDVTELTALATDTKRFESITGFVFADAPIEPWFAEIILQQAQKAASDAANAVWHTFWAIVKDGVMVGSADFKDVPQNGEVEIGYGLGPAQRHKGYMAEAVEGMCAFAKANGVISVIAETLCDNEASRNVLIRNGFVLERTQETMWWRKML